MTWLLVATALAAPLAALAVFTLWATGPVVRIANAITWSSAKRAGALPPDPDLTASRQPDEQTATNSDAAVPGYLGPTAGETPTAVTVLTYNVGFASGMANNRPVRVDRETGRRNLHAIMSILAVQQPDIAGLQEVDGLARRSFYVDQPRELARAAAVEHGAFAANWNKRYVAFPYWPPSVQYGPIFSGQAVLSRYPILEHEVIPLPQPAAKGPLYRAFYLRRLIQRTRITLPGREAVTVLNLHLEPFDQENRRRHAEIVATVVESIDDPVIVLGDCNAPPVYATVRSGFPSDIESVDFSTDRTLEILTTEAGLSNAFDEARYLRNETAALTFPSDGPVVTLDYILHSGELETEDASVIRRNASGSDHFPVAARLRLL